MLHTDPVPRLESRGYARIFQQRPSLSRTHPDGRGYNTEAFHWGSLTTGHWLTSLWVLLAPFAFANVAGWMAGSRKPIHRSFIRIAALALTGLFVAQIGYVVFGVPLWFATGQQWATPESLRWIRTALGLGYVLIFGAVVLRLSAQSHFEPLTYRDRFRLVFSPVVNAMTPRGRSPNWEDPADAHITDPVMWDVHSIVHRLRRLHFAGGVLVIALSLARTVGNDLLINLALIGLALVLAALVLTTHRPEGRTGLAITSWMPLVSEALALLAVVAIFMSDIELDLLAFHRTTFEVAIALGVAGLLTLIAGIQVLGAITIGTLFGGALGVGAGFIAEDLTSINGTLVEQGGAWVAPAALIFVLTMATAALVLTFRGNPEVGPPSPGNAMITRITRHSRHLLTVAAGFGLASGAIAYIQGCLLPGTTCRPDQLSELAGVDTIVTLFLIGIPVLMAIRFWRLNTKLAVGAVVAAIAVTGVALMEPAWGNFAPADYLKALPLARIVIFIGPVAAIGRSVFGAYRQGASSRKVGILWDVASFWPRWYHPLAPPAYGPKVVTTLREHLESGEVDILAGHSQGSVIAAVATSQAVIAGAGRPTGLLTYGSPLEMLYRTLFPDVGIEELTEELPGKLDRGWINLWRHDDPIGGSALGGEVVNGLATGSGHSGYELTATYRRSRDQLA